VPAKVVISDLVVQTLRKGAICIFE
jgi:hypothetical protein